MTKCITDSHSFIKRIVSGLEALDEPQMSDTGFGIQILHPEDTKCCSLADLSE